MNNTLLKIFFTRSSHIITTKRMGALSVLRLLLNSVWTSPKKDWRFKAVSSFLMLPEIVFPVESFLIARAEQ
jgi:hypothetical protein